MAIALKNIITAIYAKLIGNATLMGKITGVFNFAPQNQAFPFVVIGDSDILETKFNTFGRKGKQTRIFLHIYSNYKGDSEVLDIAETIDNILDYTSLTVTSNTHILTSFENLELVTEDDDSKEIKVRHGVVEYRVITQEV